MKISFKNNQPLFTHLIFFYLLTFANQACDTSILYEKTATERACEPGLQSGCSQGEHCSLNAQGTPICLSLPSSPLQINERCESSDECISGSGCIQLLGETRCSLFCSLERLQEESDEYCQDRLGNGSQCMLSILGREEIGICSVPCNVEQTYLPNAQDQFVDITEDLTAQSCLGNESCSVPIGLPYATCQISGELVPEDLCGINRTCRQGLSCVRNGGLARCKEVYLSSRCEPQEIETTIQYARDPITGNAYHTCWSDIALQAVDLSGIHYRLMLKNQRGQEVNDICTNLTSVSSEEIYHFQDFSLINMHHQDLFIEISELLDQLGNQGSGVWLSAEGQTCYRLDLTSATLEPTLCELELPVLCAYLPQTL